jgi:hypothetical protein
MSKVDYLAARIEELHNDVREIKKEVTMLKEDFTKRSVIYKMLTWAGGLISAILLGSISHLLGKP